MLLERATRDALTKLRNRQAILEILYTRDRYGHAASDALAIALIDIDHFKRINDTMGDLARDEVLRVLGAQLSGRSRACDALGRCGGEELLLIMSDASRLQRIISEVPFSYKGSMIRVTATSGVAWLTSDSDSAEDVIGRADQALYTARYAGRDRVEFAATGS